MTRAVVLGDVIDDVIVVPQGSIRTDTDTPSVIERAAGGSGANAAAWLAASGLEVDFVGRVGAADLDRHSAALEATGVTPHLVADPSLQTGAIVIVVEGDHRTMLTDRGASGALSPDDVPDALLADAGLLHSTGYSVLGHEAAFARLTERAHDAGVTVSHAPGSIGSIADAGLERYLDAIAGVDVLIANLDEAWLLTRVDGEPEQIAAALAPLAPVAVTTAGRSGAYVAAEGTVKHVPAVTVDAVDPTGAGDAFAAGFLAAFSEGAGPVDAAVAGTHAAARAVSRVGARPAAIS